MLKADPIALRQRFHPLKRKLTSIIPCGLEGTRGNGIRVNLEERKNAFALAFCRDRTSMILIPAEVAPIWDNGFRQFSEGKTPPVFDLMFAPGDGILREIGQTATGGYRSGSVSKLFATVSSNELLKKLSMISCWPDPLPSERREYASGLGELDGLVGSLVE
jgi:hypothetical protein